MRLHEHHSWRDAFKDAQVLCFLTLYLFALFSIAVVGYRIEHEKIVQLIHKQMASPTAMELPKMNIVMPSFTTGAGAVKMEISLGVAEKDTLRIQKYMPMIIDRIYSCLNRTKVEELKDSTDLHLVREDMLSEINKVSGPVKVTDLYIRKLLTP